jgi:hypothetical protein
VGIKNPQRFCEIVVGTLLEQASRNGDERLSATALRNEVSVNSLAATPKVLALDVTGTSADLTRRTCRAKQFSSLSNAIGRPRMYRFQKLDDRLEAEARLAKS